MPNTVEWYDDNRRVVLQTVDPNSTWDEHFAVIKQTAEILNKLDYPVQIIVNRQQGEFYRLTPTQMRQMEQTISRNQDLVIVILTVNRQLQIARDALASVYAPRAFSKIHYVGTIEEAHSILKRERGIEL